MKKVLLLPAVILLILFTLWPLVEVVRLSFLKTNFITTSFVGFQNYIDAFSNEVFIKSIINSLLYAIILVPGMILLSLGSALFIFNMTKKWQDTARIIFYLPSLAAGIIISQFWKWVFHSEGVLNWIVKSLGFNVINWFGEWYTAIPAISMIVITSSFGGYMILFLASIQGINKELFEAAKIDGAHWGQIIRKIIIPMILPMIGMVSILTFISALQIFENIYALAPYEYSATMAFHIYETGFKFSKYGISSAEAVILLIITICLFLLKKRVEVER